jgi:hypothetical protein
MSGAEFLTVLGIISNVTAVVDFCGKVLEETIALRKNAREVPKVYHRLRVVLPLIELTLKKSKARIESGEMDREIQESLKPVVESCQVKVKELATVFEHMQASNNAGRVKLFFKSAANLWQEGKVNGLADEIMHYHLLICQTGAATLTTDEVTNVVKKFGANIDARVEELIKEIKVGLMNHLDGGWHYGLPRSPSKLSRG